MRAGQSSQTLRLAQLAFSRAELLIVLAMIMLLAAVVLPALANNRPRSHRVICANNLRQIGMALQVWGNDHRDTPPIMTAPGEGGTRGHPLAANAWLHFSWLSNQLASPQLLFCPSDTGRPARDFTGDPTGGYVHPNFANSATSYFVGYPFPSDVDLRAILAGDRNVQTAGSSGPCPQVNFAPFIMMNPPPGGPVAQWTNGLHGQTGNVQLGDGSVERLSNPGLTNLLASYRYLNYVPGSIKHLAMPR